jgi:hypothetical protein
MLGFGWIRRFLARDMGALRGGLARSLALKKISKKAHLVFQNSRPEFFETSEFRNTSPSGRRRSKSVPIAAG